MIKSQHIHLFEKYKDAPMFAFGSINKPSFVSDDDKMMYWEIYQYLNKATTAALRDSDKSNLFYVKAHKFSPKRGIRGHRPKDLWCAIRNNNSEVFMELPQIYVIVSERGIELGFAVSIPESDYSDLNIKLKAWRAIPIIHQKLPFEGEYLNNLNRFVESQSDWYINDGTRMRNGERGFDKFKTATELFTALKRGDNSAKSGSICKIIEPSFIENNPVDVQSEITHVLNAFSELLDMCKPSSPDRIYIGGQNEIDQYESDYDVSDEVSKKEYILGSIQKRRGQKKFRTGLIEIYQSECVISGCKLEEVLQAAHIYPYSGEKTNTLDNGLLLRSDIHDLFDMFLISINPENYKIVINPRLIGSQYERFSNKEVKKPSSRIKRINSSAIQWHYDKYLETLI